MGNVTGNTRIPEDPLISLEKAKKWDLEQVVICGWNKNKEFIFGGSHCEISDILLLLEVAKERLLRGIKE